MKKLALSGILIILMINSSFAQGCMTIRNLAGFGQFSQLGYDVSEDKWIMNINNRYFTSYQPIKGEEELALPENKDDRLINYMYTINFALNRSFDHGWSVTMDMPISANSIKGKVEHLSGEVHTTRAFGIGDIRLTLYKWLLKTDALSKGNIQVGLGLKLPTGDFRYEDYFYYDTVNLEAKQLAPVDPSIQLGDGGTGIITELNAFYNFSDRFSIYGNFFYLVNPRDQNGVSTLKGYPATEKQIKDGTTVNSVPDNYTIRLGGNYNLNKISTALGFRMEALPASDLIGQNNGLRRVAGFAFSVEPGILYKLNKGLLYLYVPVPVIRKTVPTVYDEANTEASGVYQVSGGRFANYLIFLGYTFTF